MSPRESRAPREGAGAVVRPILALIAIAFAGACAATGPASDPMRCPPAEIDAGALPEPRYYEGPQIAADDLVSDFDGWLSQMTAVHPDLARRADAAAIEREAARIRARLDAPMSQRRAWTVIAELNPYLRDGHSGVLMPSYRDLLDAHLAEGGRVAPFEARLTADGAVRVFRSESEAIAQGARVHAINGRPAEVIAAAMIAVAPGDTLAHRRAWVGRRFQALHWLLYGDTGVYDVSVIDASACLRRIRTPGASRVSAALQPSPDSALLFESRVLAGGVGYLRIDSFEGVYADALAAFSRRAFTAFKDAEIRALIIDLRENGGGDDAPWQQSVMDYITTTPYAHLSRYAQRITEENADPGEIVGDVQRAEYTRRITPSADNPIRFDGPVYVLVGPYTYSSAIQFTVAAQDFAIARIAGEETAALACQSGQVRPLAMPRSGLSAFGPIIVYTRPSGQGCERGVIPDLALAIDELAPDRTLDALVARVGGSR